MLLLDQDQEDDQRGAGYKTTRHGRLAEDDYRRHCQTDQSVKHLEEASSSSRLPVDDGWPFTCQTNLIQYTVQVYRTTWLWLQTPQPG